MRIFEKSGFIDHLIFVDFVPLKELVEVFKNSHFTVFPEGTSLSALEAAACGTPIITTDHPGCRDAVLDKETGILVEPRNSEAITIAISHMLDDPNTLVKMGKAGRKLAEDCFDERKVIEAHYKIYHQYTELTSY